MRLVLATVPLLTLLLPIAVAEAQVPGSYRGSCTNISQNGSTLSARCKGSGGRYNDTSIDVDQCRGQPVANSFGRLTCGGVRGSSEPVPNGDGGGYVRPRRYNDQADDGYGAPQRPRYDAPPPRYGAPPPRPPYYRQDDPDGYAPPPPRPRRYDPDQDY